MKLATTMHTMEHEEVKGRYPMILDEKRATTTNPILSCDSSGADCTRSNKRYDDLALTSTNLQAGKNQPQTHSYFGVVAVSNHGWHHDICCISVTERRKNILHHRIHIHHAIQMN